MKIQQNSLLLDNAKSKLDMIRNVLGAHANDPNVSRESIVKSAGDLIAMSHGAISPQEVANYTATMPEGGDALKSWLQQKNTEMLSAEQRLGQAIQMNDGAKQHLLRLMPNNQVTELGTLSNISPPITTISACSCNLANCLINKLKRFLAHSTGTFFCPSLMCISAVNNIFMRMRSILGIHHHQSIESLYL